MDLNATSRSAAAMDLRRKSETESCRIFAKFIRVHTATFRLDTRIYLHDNPTTTGRGNCIAAIIGKNPGSATSPVFDKWGCLSLSGDKMLPSVWNRFVAAFHRADIEIPKNAYVRVWNLFYLCDKDPTAALRVSRLISPSLASRPSMNFLRLSASV